MRSDTRPLSCLTLSTFSVLLLSVGLVGCAPLKFGSPDNAAAPAMTNSSQPSCQVVVEGKRGDSRVETVALPGPMTVEDVLHQAKATRAFSSIEIDIVRRSPETNQLHKMSVSYDTRNRRVPIEQNYAVLPNDRIVVRGSDASPFSNLLDSLMR